MAAYDFHTHSFYSDGALSPEALVDRAVTRGIKQLALTDHDTLGGVELAVQQASKHSNEIQIIPGVELSVASDVGELHIVGLNINVNHTGLVERLKLQKAARWERVERIDQKLQKCRIIGVLEHLHQSVTDVVTRTHIARALVEMGHVKNSEEAFKKYLGKNGRAKVAQEWMTMEEAIALIHSSGGLAVLAHPTRYSVSNRKMAQLIETFAEQGGDAIEISYPSISKDKVAWLKVHREKSKLMVSAGSDFHYPDLLWSDLGKFVEVERSLPHVAQFFQ